jgi:hypothetical protein
MNDEMPIVSDYYSMISVENSSKKSFDENKWLDLYKSIIYNTNYAKKIVVEYE